MLSLLCMLGMLSLLGATIVRGERAHHEIPQARDLFALGVAYRFVEQHTKCGHR
jgi:hypothetical protein